MNPTKFVIVVLLQLVSAKTIAEINGNKFISSLRGQNVTDIEGLVTAKSQSGVYVRSTKPDRDAATSESVYIFSKTIGSSVKVGDIINFDGRVEEFRNNRDYLFLTEITNPQNVRVISNGNEVEPVVIGQSGRIIGRGRLLPPTQQYSSLDGGDIFSVPNNQTAVSSANPLLHPTKYGLDFWESLSGELVTVDTPTVLGPPNSFGDTWIIGNWPVTGVNRRGGITISNRDANPEAILIGDPLDGTDNPLNSKLGDKLSTVTGIVSYAFGYYRILPLTAVNVTSSAVPGTPSVTKIVSSGSCNGLTVGAANVENLSPNSTNLPAIADTITNWMKSPDIVFLQEIQDDSGPTDNGVVSANRTLTALVTEVSRQGGTTYDFTDVAPVNNEDGGQPGGNIRVAYLYNPKVVKLANPNPGLPTDDNQVFPGPKLKYNPGRILGSDDSIFDNSRKPLAAEWETVKGNYKLFTINVHFTSKGGSTTLHGDARTPVNGGVDSRERQAATTGEFAKQILDQDRNAAIIMAGDMNEFAFVEPLRRLAEVSGLQDADDAFAVPLLERYSYFFQGNNQELDHSYVSRAIAQRARKGDFEHIHRNTWASFSDQASDHDPTVMRVNICGY